MTFLESWRCHLCQLEVLQKNKVTWELWDCAGFLTDRCDSSFQSAKDNFFFSLLYVQILGQNALAWSQWDSHFISQSWTTINLLTRIKSLFCRAISSVLLKAGCLEYAELLTDVIPLMNFVNRSHVGVLFYVSSLKASFNFSQVLQQVCLVWNIIWCTYTVLWNMLLCDKTHTAEGKQLHSQVLSFWGMQATTLTQQTLLFHHLSVKFSYNSSSVIMLTVWKWSNHVQSI